MALEGYLQETYQMLIHNYSIIIHRAISRLKSNKMLLKKQKDTYGWEEEGTIYR